LESYLRQLKRLLRKKKTSHPLTFILFYDIIRIAIYAIYYLVVGIKNIYTYHIFVNKEKRRLEMPITLSYDLDAAKIQISGLNSSSSYKITQTGSNASGYSITGLTGITQYSNYLINSGVTYTVTITDTSTNISNQIIKYVDFDGTYLIGSGINKYQQINLIYDENMSSFKPVRKDSLVETIGSKYPFIIRNSAINYKTMEFSGIITSAIDTENFSTYGNGLYYNLANERNFRDWFESWINDGAPKIFKSAPEGFKIVRIHNLNMTPVRQLGRVLHNFSCTITEIADYSIQNLIKYKLINGSESAILTYVFPSENLFPSSELYPGSTGT